MSEYSLIEKLSNDENEMVKKAHADYGEIFDTAESSIALLLECIESCDQETSIFSQYLSQVRVSLALALLSTVRRHEVQAYMMLRQALESSVLAAYGLYKPEFNEYGKINPDRTVSPDENTKNRAYKWVKSEFPNHSASIKKVKNRINAYGAHANLINSSSTFEDLGHGFNHFFLTRKIILLQHVNCGK